MQCIETSQPSRRSVFIHSFHSFIQTVLFSTYNTKLICLNLSLLTVAADIELVANSIRILPGQSVFLNCTVLRGNPKFYAFRWLRAEGHTLLSTTATSDSWGSLHLLSVQWSDVGTYECSVENSAGISKANISISFGSKYEILLCWI